MKRIAIFCNSMSGGGKGKVMAKKIGEVLMAKGLSHAFFENDWPEEMDSYSEAWIVGGDGTVNYFLNKYASIPIPIVIFPGGTGNDIHWKLYGKMDWDHQIDYVLQADKQAIDVGYCNGERFINMIGLGFDGEILKQMSRVRKIGGHLGYLLVVIKNIFTYVEKPYHFSIDGVSYSEKCLLFLVTNSSRTGGGFMVSPEAKLNDGLFNVIFTGPLSILERLMLLPKVEKGRHLTSANVRHITAKRVVLRSEDTVYFQLDGELRWGKEFEVRMEKESLWVVY